MRNLLTWTFRHFPSSWLLSSQGNVKYIVCSMTDFSRSAILEVSRL